MNQLSTSSKKKIYRHVYHIGASERPSASGEDEMSEQKSPVHLVPPINEGARDGTGHRDHPLSSLLQGQGAHMHKRSVPPRWLGRASGAGEWAELQAHFVRTAIYHTPG